MNYLEFFEANKMTFTGPVAGEYIEKSVFESYAVAKDKEIERLTGQFLGKEEEIRRLRRVLECYGDAGNYKA